MARQEIPLRDIDSEPVDLRIQALTKAVLDLRTELATHTHQITGSSGGNTVDHIMNANLDLFSRAVLKDFEFSPDDYSGAFKTGNIQWNTSTGIVTAGTGILMNKNGIVGASSGNVTFSITTDGNATFAGTLSAASGTLGAITVGTNAWHVDSSGNMWWGDYANYAAALDKVSSSGVWDRVRVIRTGAGVGYYYENIAAVNNVGLDIKMFDAVAIANVNPAIRVSYGGTGDILLGTIQSTGRGIYLQRSLGAGTANLLSLVSSNSAGGTMFDITRTGSGVITGINIDHATSSTSINTGIIMSLSSGNAAICYAFRFNGSEIVSAPVGGSQDKKLRVNVGGTDYYIALNTS